MKNVAILTDSTCCLPPELVQKYNIGIMPMIINFRGRSYRDGVDISATEIYQIMRKKEELPTTSTVSPGDFLKAFNEVGKTTDNILCITLTSLQSKTYETAIIARDMAKEQLPGIQIEVFDSRAVSGALGFIVLESARAAQDGASLENVIKRAREIQGRVNFLAIVDTLYFLARTGRIALAAHWVGSLLQLKPILEHDPAIGQTTPVARPRTMEKAIQKMLDIMGKRVDRMKVHVMVHHADELEQCQKLKETILSKFDCVEIYLSEFTPIMGVHAGPGVLAVGFYTE